MEDQRPHEPLSRYRYGGGAGNRDMSVRIPILMYNIGKWMSCRSHGRVPCRILTFLAFVLVLEIYLHADFVHYNTVPGLVEMLNHSLQEDEKHAECRFEVGMYHVRIQFFSVVCEPFADQERNYGKYSAPLNRTCNLIKAQQFLIFSSPGNFPRKIVNVSKQPQWMALGLDLC